MEALRELEERLGIIPLDFNIVKERVKSSLSETPMEDKKSENSSNADALNNILNYVQGLIDTHKNVAARSSIEICKQCEQIINVINSGNIQMPELNALLRELNGLL